ncbi:hypothetical protein [Calothrix sp. NIES-2098]|uniref:hypothetical protein n=1 Tax=Calothrix sp. NIES-2098 TaxID=1954171 RepID=UPI000B61C78F|nr:hypothetical protein NIES2098_28620 [Calothrix sp. NIES-2098]
MENLESRILEILKLGTPLRAAKIAEFLEVERREVNQCLYSSLKQLVVQDSDYKWSLKTNEIANNQRIPTQLPTPIRQDTSYRFTIKDLPEENPVTSPSIPSPSSQPIRQSSSYEFVRRELAQVSSEEKIKIIENTFRQEKFSQLQDEQINALQLILEEAKREVRIANIAYKQGKLSFWKTKSVAIALVSISLTLGTLFVMKQLRANSIFLPTPTFPKSK